MSVPGAPLQVESTTFGGPHPSTSVLAGTAPAVPTRLGSALEGPTNPIYGPASGDLAALVVFGVVLWLANKTRLGHTAIYYALLLMIFFILVTQYARIASVLSPLSNAFPNPAPIGAGTANRGGLK